MPTEFVSLWEWGKNAGLAGLLAFIIFGSNKGWFYWAREYKKLEAEKDEYKSLAMRGTRLAEASIAIHPASSARES